MNKYQGKSAEDIISRQLLLLLEEIKKEGRANERQEHLLDSLRVAKEANGEAGAILKAKALQQLKREGVFGVSDAEQRLSEQVPIAKAKLFDHLKTQGWSDGNIAEFINVFQTGQLETAIRKGNFPNVEGLDKLLFGRKMTEEQLKNLLDPEDKKNLGGSLLLLLLLLAVGSTEVVKQVVPMQNQ